MPDAMQTPAANTTVARRMASISPGYSMTSIERSGSLHMPVGRNDSARTERGVPHREHVGAAHAPDRELSIRLPPDDVVLAITVVVGKAVDLPSQLGCKDSTALHRVDLRAHAGHGSRCSAVRGQQPDTHPSNPGPGNLAPDE